MTDVPVLMRTITPKTKADQEKLVAGLRQLVTEDPTLRVQNGRLTGQAVIAGVGELQLEIVCDRLTREFGVEATVGAPQVAYRETLTRAADGEMKYAKQSGGRGQYAHVKIHLFPGAPDTGYVFENMVQRGAIPKEYINPIDEGVKDALARGVLTGHPLPDVRIELYDGSYHEVDSSDVAFRIAGSLAFQDAAKKAKPMLLEPIMHLELALPKEQLSDAGAAGGVGGDLHFRRRARIQAHEARGGTMIVHALVPLAAMLGYAADLRAATQGCATFTLTFDRYESVGGGSDRDDDRDSYVGWPVTPRRPLNHSAIALPEPDDV